MKEIQTNDTVVVFDYIQECHREAKVVATAGQIPSPYCLPTPVGFAWVSFGEREPSQIHEICDIRTDSLEQVLPDISHLDKWLFA